MPALPYEAVGATEYPRQTPWDRPSWPLPPSALPALSPRGPRTVGGGCPDAQPGQREQEGKKTASSVTGASHEGPGSERAEDGSLRVRKASTVFRCPLTSSRSSSRLKEPFAKLTRSPCVFPFLAEACPRLTVPSAQGRPGLSVCRAFTVGTGVPPLFYAQDTDLTVPHMHRSPLRVHRAFCPPSAVSFGGVLGPLCVEFCKYDGLTCKEGG